METLQKADEEYDDTKRGDLFKQAQKLMYDSAWMVYMWFANGNFLVTASNSAKILEVTPAGSVVMTIDGGPLAGFGYTEFRESLYGPPPY